MRTCSERYVDLYKIDLDTPYFESYKAPTEEEGGKKGYFYLQKVISIYFKMLELARTSDWYLPMVSLEDAYS